MLLSFTIAGLASVPLVISVALINVMCMFNLIIGVQLPLEWLDYLQCLIVGTLLERLYCHLGLKVMPRLIVGHCML